jgi:hypothetical protein
MPPPLEPLASAGENDEGEADAVEPETEASVEPEAPPSPGGEFTIGNQYAAIWVDLVTFEPRRIDLRSGVQVWLGPVATFDKVQVPSWIRIVEPGKRPATFDVMAVSPVDAPAAAFSRSWLERPIEAAPPPAETARGPLSRENP